MIGAGARLGLSALDVVRTFGLRVLGRAAAPIYATSRARLVTFALMGLVTSIVLAVVAPAWSIAVGTLGLGALHVISDVRYLVVRRGLARRASVYVAVAAATLATALGYGLDKGNIASFSIDFQICDIANPYLIDIANSGIVQQVWIAYLI